MENTTHQELQHVERIKMAISEAGLSQKELASKMGVNPSTITRYLNGMRVAEKNKQLLADALGVSKSWLFLGIQSDERTELSQVDFSSQEIALLKECIALAQQTYTKAEGLVAGKARAAVKEEIAALNELFIKLDALQPNVQTCIQST